MGPNKLMMMMVMMDTQRLPQNQSLPSRARASPGSQSARGSRGRSVRRVRGGSDAPYLAVASLAEALSVRETLQESSAPNLFHVTAGVNRREYALSTSLQLLRRNSWMIGDFRGRRFTGFFPSQMGM